MMHAEAGYNIDVMVYPMRRAGYNTRAKRAAIVEAERIALAAAVDALRGPKAEPVYSDCVCRYCRMFYLRWHDNTIFSGKCAPCIVSKANKHFSGCKMVETK